MTRVRHRRSRSRRFPTPVEAFYLKTGHVTVGADGELPFWWRGAVDEAEARAAWEQYRDELTAEYTEKHPGLKPWAALAFDGEAGHSSRYCHLGAPHCHEVMP